MSKNKQELARLIWNSAQNMRGSIEASRYKDYIFGFMFYKFLSEKEERFLKNIGMPDVELVNLTEDDKETVTYIQDNIGYFISYDNLFSTWLKKGGDLTIDTVRTGLSAFERNINKRNKNMFNVFSGIFDTMQSNIRETGNTDAEQTRFAKELIKIINEIPMDGKEDYDVLGYVYEYLIKNFAAGAGKKAGEFYSPAQVGQIISGVIAHHHRNKQNISVYDMTAGSSSLLITVGKAVSSHMNNPNGVKYYAQELITDTYNLARMNLIMKDVLPDNIVIRNGNTLEDDWPFFDDADKESTYVPVWVDAVAANPPYSARFDNSKCADDPRYVYGVAPSSKADYAFLQHGLYHLNDDGIMGIVLPHGVLFRGNEEETIRRNLIEHRHIEAIVGLPAGIFFGTGIPTIIVFLKKKRKTSDILFIDASKDFSREGKQNVLRKMDVKKITDTVINRTEIPGYSRVVSLEEIKANSYNLNIPRYIDSSEKQETYDIYASMFGGIPAHELDNFGEYWKAFPNLRNDIFTEGDYVTVKSENLHDFILEHRDIKNFIKAFNKKFKYFDEYLKGMLFTELADNKNRTINSLEPIIAEEIFSRFKKVPILDKYEAYQIFADNWETISSDLEVIEKDGIGAAKIVEPNMVQKSQKGKNVEIQEGWKGKLLPFNLVQKTLLTDKLESLQKTQNRVDEIASEMSELLDSLSEDQKEREFVKEGNAFIWPEVKKALKDKCEDEETKAILQKAYDLSEEEKNLKKEIKAEEDKLVLLTKETIENLTTEQVYDFLTRKWIDSVVNGIEAMPVNAVKDFVTKIEAQAHKYDTTLDDIEAEMRKTESELCGMIGQLVGNEYDMKGLAEFARLLGGTGALS